MHMQRRWSHTLRHVMKRRRIPIGISLAFLPMLMLLACRVSMQGASVEVVEDTSPTPVPSDTPTPAPTPFGGSGVIGYRTGGFFDPNELLVYEFETERTLHVPSLEGITSFISPRWSPDGEMIAFASYIEDDIDIYVMRADGSGLQNLTEEIGGGGFPDWSPNGRRLAFTCSIGGSADICVQDADGGNLMQLTTGPAVDRSPRWSPDGSLIAFESNRDVGDYESEDGSIYVMHEDGTGITRLTHDPGADGSPSWSPDGEWIAFISDRTGPYEIYSIRPDGTELQQLTSGGESKYSPEWSVDGTLIAFVMFEGEDRVIYVMDSDGGEIRPLLDGLEDASALNWLPSMAFEILKEVASAAPTSEPTAQIPLATLTLQASRSPTLVATPVETKGPPAILSQDGPWLVFPGGTQPDLLAVNADGTGLGELPLPDSSWGQLFPSPHGGRFAYVSGDPIPSARLIVAELPSGEVEFDHPLFSEGWNELVESRSFMEISVWSAVDGSRSMAWSPDGRFLAFIAALHAASADLYLYDTIDSSVRRLTTGEHQAYDPSWSPDGRWIVHLEVANFGTGAGWNVQGVWAVDTESYEVTRLIAAGGRMYFVEKWANPGEFILSEWDAGYGENNLSTYRLEEHGLTRFLHGPFTQAAFDTTGSRVALFIDEYAARDQGVDPGVYLLPRYGGELKPVITDEDATVQSLLWSAALDRFIAGLATETVLFDRQGDITTRIQQGGHASVSPDGRWLVIYGSSNRFLSVYTGDAAFVGELAAYVDGVVWSPDSRTLFLTLNGHLEALSLAGMEPGSERPLISEVLADDVPTRAENYYWVGN